MARPYLLKTHLHFAAAHRLRGYQGDCEQLHGHNYKVEIEVRASGLDDVGMGIDFREIRALAGEILGEIDHRYLNEIPPFDEVNPTAEHIAAWIFERLARRIDREHAKLQAIVLWETERDAVRYGE